MDFLSGFFSGMRLAKFMEAMAEKLVKSDADQDIRHTFMAFDSQCKNL